MLKDYEHYFQDSILQDQALMPPIASIACANVRVALNILGYDAKSNEPKYQYDDALQQAVLKFQSDNNHRIEDGIVGPGTRRLLVEKLFETGKDFIFERLPVPQDYDNDVYFDRQDIEHYRDILNADREIRRKLWAEAKPYGSQVPKELQNQIDEITRKIGHSDSLIMDLTKGIRDRSYSANIRKSSIHKKPTENMASRILFLAADPSNASRLRLGEEFREIQEKLKLAKLREQFILELPQLSVRPADISQALLDVQPQVVHFSGHGASTGALCFENQLGQTHLIEPDALAALFEQFAHQVSCVLLNACYSEIQAKAIGKHIKYVIGMNQAIGDKAAIAFAIGFYQALGAGRTIEQAYKLGCVQIQLHNIPEHLTPVLIRKK